MKQLSKVFNGVDIPVEVQDENNMWFDISNINRELKVRFSEWKNSNRVKNTLKLHEKSLSLNRPLIDDEVYGKNFIHRKMFTSFARFVSIEFEIKADEIIMDILLGEKHLCDQKFETLQIENKQQAEQLRISQKQTREAKRKTHAYPRGNGFETKTRIIEDHAINITHNDFNEIMEEVGLLESEIVEIKHYTSAKMSGVVPLLHTDTVLSILDARGYKRGISYIDTHPTLFEDS